MKKTVMILVALAAAALMSACSKDESSFQTVEEQRAQGRSNASLVASDYQRQNPRIQGWEPIVKADTSHTAKCPQGDGWAEVVFMNVTKGGDAKTNLQIEKATVMCSTVSFNEGCVMVAPTNNWDKHPKKSMDGSCAPTSEVPMPLPKVVAGKL